MKRDMRPDLERLLSRVQYEANSGCWLHEATPSRDGHITVWQDERSALAHRVSWQLHNGPIPAGLHVCHKCDTPACVNPAHLFLGTPRDNVLDRIRKGRSNYARGSRHVRAKLTETLIPEIIRRIAFGETQGEVARDLGLSQGAISAMLHGRTWRDVPRDEALTTRALEACVNWTLRPSRQRRPGRRKAVVTPSDLFHDAPQVSRGGGR